MKAASKNIPSASKRKPTLTASSANDGTFDSWIDRFAPSSKEKLAVHKKKIDEVDDWLRKNTTLSPLAGAKAPILLIVGPTGSGKSTTLNVVAKELDIHIKEWSHPITSDHTPYVEGSRQFSGNPEIKRESVIDNFMDFLFQGSRYKSLFDEDQKRIVLLEEIPSMFLKKPEEFHECLRKFRNFGRCPLIIILCETSSSREFKLFPPDFKKEIGIHTISFNPVAATILTKAIKDIVASASKACGKQFSHPTESSLDSIIQGCQGDLRLAVNLLEVTCMGAAKKVQNFSSGAKKTRGASKTKADSKSADSLKDSSLYLFHSLGKILYCKRDEKIIDKLPEHLKQHERPPTKENPEDVFDRTCVSQELFIRMLHNNASNFYGSIKSASQCLDWFSIGDHIGHSWDASGQMQSLSLSVTLRGLMFAMEKKTGKSHFGTFKKPTFDRRTVDDLGTEVRFHFLMTGTSTDVLVRDILPYSYLIKPELNADQWNVINKCVLVRRSNLVTKAVDLSINEKDILDDDNDDDQERTLKHKQDIIESVEDDFEIEEMDFD